jgi:hypothetical protein
MKLKWHGLLAHDHRQDADATGIVIFAASGTSPSKFCVGQL